MTTRTLQFNIYRFDPDKDQAPRMQDISVEVDSTDRKLLDALVKLKAKDDTLSFRRSCREGVCGSDAMNINGRNGLACLTDLSSFAEGKPIVLRPLPGWADHRTPIAALYLCGSGTHAGGGISGAAGRNAAKHFLAGRLPA